MSANIVGMGTVSTAAPHVDAAQMNQFCSFVNMLGDPNAKDETKLKAAQELSENFELITQCSRFGAFLDHSMKIFIKILQDGEPHFISEYNIQQVRTTTCTNTHARTIASGFFFLFAHQSDCSFIVVFFFFFFVNLFPFACNRSVN